MQKVLTKNQQNQTTEIEVYTPSDFKSTNTGVQSPVKTRSDGYIDPSLIPGAGTADSAQKLEALFTAGEIISALKFVFMGPNEKVLVASSAQYESSVVIGITISSAQEDENIRVLLFGKLDDPFFSFPVSASLFLTESGSASSTVPESGTRTKIGHSLATGSIFIKIEEPIQL